MPSFGQYALDVVDETGRCTAHWPRQDQVGEPPASDVRKCGEALVRVDVMPSHDVPARPTPRGEHRGDVADVDDMRSSARPEREAAEQDPEARAR
jgi:hypothetical protein